MTANPAIRLAAIGALAMAGCADVDMASYGDSLTDPQLPPRGNDDLLAWIDAGYYKAWRCEPAPHPQRSPSPHGVNRICNNELLTAAGDGPFPVGAAAVKEIFARERIAAYAVARKLTAGDGGDRWYWFEGSEDSVGASGQGLGGCTGCHELAARDFVFTVVP